MIKTEIGEIKLGTKVTYDIFKNVTFEGTDEAHVFLKDKFGNEKKVYKSLFKKFGSIETELMPVEDKQYREIKFLLGSSIDEAVEELMSYKNEGILAYGKFNGATLYSNTVTIDDAYKEITGKTKAEFDVHLNGI